ncbi:MAG: PKD domain-containing protein [Proteobacteria bacterium]|nr:PKD domain-containing protein [Pseudomonadota bacterium]
MSKSSFQNYPPVASAGRDKTVMLGDPVILDATGSVDPDGDPLVYYWNFVSRPEGSHSDLNDPRFVHARFVPDRKGEYVLNLQVSDKSGESGQAAVKITVE